VKAEKQERAAAREAERAEEHAERRAAHASPAPKKERGRSENLDPEIDA